jgi:hypothetical protein
MDNADIGKAKEKLDKAISEGVARAGAVVQQVMTMVPQDVVAKTAALTWVPRGRDVALDFGQGVRPIHDHAMRQIGEVAGIPRAYVETLLDPDQEERMRVLLAHNLSEMFQGRSQRHHLIRNVSGAVRGFLSDRYRRLDSRPLLDAFVAGVQEHGAVPYAGRAGDVRATIKAIVPRVHIAGGDAIAIGMEWSNSDFGAGTHTVRMFILRLICLNGATAEDAMRQVHLGKRLEEDMEFSDKTLRLDTQTNVSALRDVVRGALAPAKVEGLIAKIDKAQGASVSWANLKARLAKTLTKAELAAAESAFTGPDVINLPPEPTLWRASNALSWIAKSANEDRALEMEKLAGGLLDNKIVLSEAA